MTRLQTFAVAGPAEHFVPASKRRLLLAIYLDFLLYGIPWGIANYALLEFVPEFEAYSSPAKALTFTALELLLHLVFRWSPGTRFLSITYLNPSDGLNISIAPDSKGMPAVDSATLAAETNLSLLVATLMTLEGAKGFVRWVEYSPPAPMFGALVSDAAWPVVAMGGGAIECLIAYLIFKLDKRALWIGVPYFAANLLSAVLSWPLWTDWAARAVTMRRAAQGAAVRPGEIETLQGMMPAMAVGACILYLAGLFVVLPTLRKFQRH